MSQFLDNGDNANSQNGLVRPNFRPNVLEQDTHDREQIDPKVVWSALADSRWLIVVTTVAVAVLATLFGFFSPMNFEIDGSLYLGDAQSQKSNSAQALDVLGNMGESPVGTELEVILSRSLL